jgi:hypothetical protein
MTTTFGAPAGGRTGVEASYAGDWSRMSIALAGAPGSRLIGKVRRS